MNVIFCKHGGWLPLLLSNRSFSTHVSTPVVVILDWRYTWHAGVAHKSSLLGPYLVLSGAF